jgi:hypothetical protein
MVVVIWKTVVLCFSIDEIYGEEPSHVNYKAHHTTPLEECVETSTNDVKCVFNIYYSHLEEVL